MTDRNGWSPLEITPGDVGAAATPEALVEHLDSIDLAGLLVREKAVVFRGFKVPGEGLDPVLDRLLPRRLSYVHGNSPRTKVGSNVYTSTEYPQEYTISMHNEMSYAHAWPTRLAFYCAVAPETGGATPVVDAALWLEALDPEVREAFEAGVRYTPCMAARASARAGRTPSKPGTGTRSTSSSRRRRPSGAGGRATA
ncbi:TauD/TfdA family dioxygenase [Streptomyces mirabilis]|uniref:TauD/TfdA family dioxygenase n=1 Tax=Streptomyces mirabilis TaxID=68239 RepID=UPI0036DCC33F